MIAIQKRQDQGFDPTPTREPMGGMGREKTVDHGGNLQTLEYSQNQGKCATGYICCTAMAMMHLLT